MPTCTTIKVDHEGHHIYVDGKEVYLAPKLYNTLRVFLDYPGKVLDRDNIFFHLYGADDFAGNGSRMVDQWVSRLRKILGDSCITTINKRGYRFDGQVG